MRCYFMRSGKSRALFLKSGPDDTRLVEEARSVFEQHAGQNFDGFEVWTALGSFTGPTYPLPRAALRGARLIGAQTADSGRRRAFTSVAVYRFRFSLSTGCWPRASCFAVLPSSSSAYCFNRS